MNWSYLAIGNACNVRRGTTITQTQSREGVVPVVAGGLNATYYHDTPNRQGNVITISASGANAGFVNFWSSPIFASDCSTVETDGENVDIKFVYYFLRSKQDYINSKLRSGAAQPHVYAKDIAQLQLPLPPVNEQRRIAAILDQADALRAKRRDALVQLDSLTQSIFIEMFGDPITNPKGLPVLPLIECAEVIQIGPFGTQLHEGDYIEGGIPLVNPTHIKAGKICPDLTLTVSKLKYKELANYYLNEGDLILGRRGEMGRCAVISSTEHGWLCGTGSLFVRPKKQILHPIFLGLVVSSPSMRRHLESVAQGVTMANLNKTIVGLLPIPTPQMAAQMKMVSALKSVEALKATHRAALQELDRLFASLQHSAFSGEL